MLDFKPETLRKHFEKLTADYDKVDAKLQPLRDELDKLVAGDTKLSVKEANKREAALRTKIKTLQNEQYPIEMERATVARALGGKTSPPPAE